MELAFKLENAAYKASAFSSLLQAVTEVAFNGVHKTEEYEEAFNFLCNVAFEHAEDMKEMEEEAFAIARGGMAAGREVT